MSDLVPANAHWKAVKIVQVFGPLTPMLEIQVAFPAASFRLALTAILGITQKTCCFMTSVLLEANELWLLRDTQPFYFQSPH